MIFKSSGTRCIDFDLYDDDIDKLKKEWERYVLEIPPHPGTCKGKGVVMCIGGLSYFTCGIISLKILRSLGCTLPVEAWYYGNELSGWAISELTKMGATCRDFTTLGAQAEGLYGCALKPLAIIHSRFKEVLFIDADNVCVNNPEPLFDCPRYLETGAIFWPDYWETEVDNPIWRIIGKEIKDEKEQESGQIVVDREKCWQQLNLCLYFNRQSAVYHQLLLGDKDTFRFAWMALNSPYHMIPTAAGACGYHDEHGNFLGITMLQHDAAGNIAFLHRNLLKWDITMSNERRWTHIKRFSSNATQKKYCFSFSPNGHNYIDLIGDIETIASGNILGDCEETCASYLQEMRSDPNYNQFVLHDYFAGKRFRNRQPFLLQ